MVLISVLGVLYFWAHSGSGIDYLFRESVMCFIGFFWLLDGEIWLKVNRLPKTAGVTG